MRNTRSETFIPKEVRETYIIFIGFWASYLFGDIFYNAKADPGVITCYIIGGVFIIYFGMNIAAAFDNKAAMTGSLPCYFFGLLCWAIVCSALYCLQGDLRTATSSGALTTCHIWLAVVIYGCRIFATEILRLWWL